MGLIKEFREFALKGNVVDMAVGIIIGAAFNNITTSLVNDVIMPPIGMALGRVDFKKLQILLQSEVKDNAGKVTTPEVAIHIGAFVNTCIDFLIVAMSVFVVIKVMNRMMRLRAEQAGTPPGAPPAA